MYLLDVRNVKLIRLLKYCIILFNPELSFFYSDIMISCAKAIAYSRKSSNTNYTLNDQFPLFESRPDYHRLVGYFLDSGDCWQLTNSPKPRTTLNT